MSARASARRGSGSVRTGESGQALLELALVTPVLVLLFVSVVQFGVIFQREIGIENAVREAARRGATMDTDPTNAAGNAAWTLGELQTLLLNLQGHDAAQERDLQVCYYTPAAPNDVDPLGNKQVLVKVQAGYAHPLFLPLISGILDGIDGVGDDALRADTSSEFHVEQETAVDLGGTSYCATPP
ncbi:MAG TPA: TadE/TadG family type IV pilus assembly protein [Candidatus Limnocylindrales bacterium]|nr:TadE/TadG family type IV pilus assembly protein [Candidatus Limnocylindrales bacterium]